LSILPKFAPETSSETTEAAANPNPSYPTALPSGGGGIDGNLEVVGGVDGIDEELLQLRLPLPLCRWLGLPMAALPDQPEDAGESLIGDEVLGANPRARKMRRRGSRRPPCSRGTHARKTRPVPRKSSMPPRRRGSAGEPPAHMRESRGRGRHWLARASHLLKPGGGLMPYFVNRGDPRRSTASERCFFASSSSLSWPRDGPDRPM
jgi:hypothetical protein